MIPNVIKSFDKMIEENEEVTSTQMMTQFAIEILKYNLKQYKTQMLQFNTGDATKFKSFDEITLETIKELENGK